MKHCFHHWKEICTRLSTGQGVFLALDYDGVLSPIAARPGLAKIPRANQRLLQELARRPGVTIAIVSGRALRDVRHVVGLDGLIYAGNHGAEIQINGGIERHIPLQRYRRELLEVESELIAIAESFDGAHVEDKGFGIGLHYREVPGPRVPLLRRRFDRFAKTLSPELTVKPAKMMFEVRPRAAWDKGSAVLRIWEQVAPAAVPICLGDDRTDEDGFRALRKKGITIFVGTHQDSVAEYYLESPREVTQLLKRLAKLTRGAARVPGSQAARVPLVADQYPGN